MKIQLGKSRINMSELAKLCGGHCASDKTGALDFGYVCTDSREADVDTLFCTIRGERVDGHDYIASASALGCRCVLCERIPEGIDLSKTALVVVPDTVKALNLLARGYSEQSKRKTVAITGSVGKTTTKEFVASVFPKEKTYRTKGNFNSVIGLPLSMLEIRDDTEFAVLEMGMSGRGEIAEMSAAARPDIAVITNIGSSHLELLGTRENIRAAKLEIVTGMDKTGTLIVNGDDAMLTDIKADVKVLKVGMESPENDICAVNVRSRNGSTTFDISFGSRLIKSVSISAYGRHNIYAALFAFASAVLLGINEGDAVKGLLTVEKPKMRQNIYDFKGIKIIEDCYNASPESMRAALEVQAELVAETGGRSVALLGNMLELGEGAARLHYEVGEFASRCKVSKLVTYGELAKSIADGAKLDGTVCITDTNDPVAAADALMEILTAGDVLLVKASRGVAAEKILEIIKERL